MSEKGWNEDAAPSAIIVGIVVVQAGVGGLSCWEEAESVATDDQHETVPIGQYVCM